MKKNYYVSKEDLRKNFNDSGAAFMNERECAGYLGVSLTFLRRRRSEGNPSGLLEGPPWICIGRSVKYRKADLDAFIEKNIHGAEVNQ